MRVVVIGGTQGISASLIDILENRGDSVVAVARSGEADYQCDVADFSNPLPEIEGVIEGLVYSPGTVNLKPLNAISMDDFRKDWEINALGAFRVVKHYLEQLQQAEAASLVFFSAVAVKVGMPFHASVAAAKGAVEGMVRSLAAELCPKIRVNAIAPSLTDTPLVQQLLKNEDKRNSFAKRHPLQRIGSPEEVASMAAFLLSNTSSWITGQVFRVDGGISSTQLF